MSFEISQFTTQISSIHYFKINHSGKRLSKSKAIYLQHFVGEWFTCWQSFVFFFSTSILSFLFYMDDQVSIFNVSSHDISYLIFNFMKTILSRRLTYKNFRSAILITFSTLPSIPISFRHSSDVCMFKAVDNNKK